MEGQLVSAVIKEDGTLLCLDTEATTCFRSLGITSNRRASHVEPDFLPFRIVFHILRRFFGDKGRMSDITRKWPCLWRVNVSPLGGPILPGRWISRKAAIEAEVEYLNANLL